MLIVKPPQGAPLNLSDPINKGLAGYWNFSEGGGVLVRDSSGHSNTGTITGSPPWIAGVTGRALSLNGTSQYVTAPDSPSLSPINALTISAWVKRNGTQALYSAIVSKPWSAGGGPTYTSYALEVNPGTTNGGISLFLGKSGGFDRCTSNAGDVLPDGQEVFVTATWSNLGAITLYVNGRAVAQNGNTSKSSAIVYTGANPTLIGYNGSAAYFKGTINEVRIYNRGLSPGEVLALYNNSANRFVTTWPRRTPGAFGSTLVLNLTGFGESATQGALVDSFGFAISGQSATSSQGTLSYSAGTVLNISLSGFSETAAPGAIAFSAAFGLLGSQETAAPGALVFAPGFALSGVQDAAAQGAAGYSAAIGLLGSQDTTTQGALGFTLQLGLGGILLTDSPGILGYGPQFSLPGFAEATAQGAFGYAANFPLSGFSESAYQGALGYHSGALPVYVKGANLYYDIGSDLAIMLGAPKMTYWNTAGRPAHPATAEFGFNTDNSKVELWNGSAWVGSLFS